MGMMWIAVSAGVPGMSYLRRVFNYGAMCLSNTSANKTWRQILPSLTRQQSAGKYSAFLTNILPCINIWEPAFLLLKFSILELGDF
jgi:hypothetical protein